MRWMLFTTLVLFVGCDGSGMTDGDSGPRSDAGRVPRTDSGARADGGALPLVVSPCDALADVGVWEEITPWSRPGRDGIASSPPAVLDCPYGGHGAMDPQDPATYLVGSCEQGVFKTTDCGATWVHLDSGRNGEAMSQGRQWTFVIDPVDPDVIYTNTGYGLNGAWKSTNGGVDWDPLWPPADGSLAGLADYDFVGAVVLDPYDHEHLLITFHAECNPPHSNTTACFVESTNGGESFRVVEGEPEWAGGEGTAVYFLESSDVWMFGSESNGLWRSEDRGANWTFLTNGIGHGKGALYRTPSGTFFLGTAAGLVRSDDGIDWTSVDATNLIMGVTGFERTLFASRGFPWDPSDDLYLPFWTSTDDGENWEQLASPMLSNGGSLDYDPVHHLLYSTNLGAGVWRVRLE